ncbi:MAG TPA: CDC27 family protein [Chitinophagaceae bacterium]|nr:CDC27 family protein [Chitinophagaceae bacterium]
MVDPKKEYELLMRYLQNGGLKNKAVPVPDSAIMEEWKPSLPTQPITRKSVLAEKGKKKQLSSINAYNFLSKLPSFTIAKRIRLAIALVSVIVLSIGIWKGVAFVTLSGEGIYNKIYRPFTDIETQPPANSIEQYYSTGNFVAATLKSRKQVQRTDKETLLTGLAYMQRNDYNKAIKWLEPAANNFKNPYRQQAEYYLALSYLKNEDYDQCIERLEHIVYTPSNPYKKNVSPQVIRDIKILKWR